MYVKGREYETNHDPRFLAERDIVVKNGGRVVFSSGDVIFSSTALIDSLKCSELFNDEKVRRFRQQCDLSSAALANLLQRCRGKKMVVVGDYVLDRYHFCDAVGVASESPMMTLRSLDCREYDGGAGIIAAHLCGLGAATTLITALADDAAATRLQGAGVQVCAISRIGPVTKSRFLVDESKLFKLDQGTVAPLDSATLDQIANLIIEHSTDADGVVFADFGYGLITAPLLARVLPIIRPRVPILTADVSGRQNTLPLFKRVDLLCPTEREVRQTLNNFSSGLNAVVYDLLRLTDAKAALITLGKQGVCIFDQQQQTAPEESWDRKLRAAYLPALGRRAVDPLGCGDALLAAASLSLAGGGSLAAAAYLGSLAAAIELQQLGNRPIDADQLLSALDAWADSPSQHIRLAS